MGSGAFWSRQTSLGGEKELANRQQPGTVVSIDTVNMYSKASFGPANRFYTLRTTDLLTTVLTSAPPG
jgi:hypothetical protein